jgi:hypothetical protein
MIEILKPGRLIKTLLLLFVIVSVSHLFACRPGGGGGLGDGDSINPDTIKRHILPIAIADQYTASFRASIDSFNRSCPHFKDSMQFGHAESFPKDVFLELLRQKSDSGAPAAGIRIYYGRDSLGKIRQILVAVDSNGNDIITHIMDANGKPTSGVRAEALTVTGGQTLQDGTRCPTACGDSASGLN